MDDNLLLKNENFKTINDYVKKFKEKYFNEHYAINDQKINELIKKLLDDDRKNVISLGNSLLNGYRKLQSEFDRVSGMYKFDKSFGNFKLVAGIDEVGRGPLAGPIVAAAVILKEDIDDDIILGINDSKKLSESQRVKLSKIIKEKAVSYSIAEIDNKEIDVKGIGWCNNEVFKIAYSKLALKPELVLSDGYPIKGFNGRNVSVVKGDNKSACIACASIIAKVYRDNLMKEYAAKYPQYGFDKHVGYGTSEHIEAIKRYGKSEIHRNSFLKNII